MKQKRQTGAGGMVQASNISSATLGGRSAGWQRDLRGERVFYNSYNCIFNILIISVISNFFLFY